MKRVLLIAALSAAGFLFWTSTHSAAPPAEKVLRHVVLFKFKEGTPAKDVDAVVKAFGALPSKISEVHAYEWGTDVSPEKLSKGLTHCFQLTFKTEAGRDVYLKHAAHTEFVGLLKPILDDATVVDYWTN